MTTEVIISFNELRRIVVSLYTQGSMMKQPHLTFSHGNTGNEFLSLSDRIDRFVLDLEPRHILVIQKAEDQSTPESRLQEEINVNRDVLKQHLEFKRKLAWILGCAALDPELLGKAEELINCSKISEDPNPDLSIEELDLGNDVYKTLRSLEILTIGQLIQLTKTQLKYKLSLYTKIKNPATTATVIRRKLSKLGLKLAQDQISTEEI